MERVSRRTAIKAVAGGIAAAGAVSQGAQAAGGSVFRLGIVGSDNSHALAFSRLANVDSANRVEGVAVTHIYGTDAEVTRSRAEEGKVPNIVARQEDMIGHVDGIAVTWRHASKHLGAAMPFLEAGIPVYIDKPFTATVEDARKLVAAAQKAKVGFGSFSNLRYADITRQFVAEIPEQVGAPTGGMVAGSASMSSEYDGLIFYGIHTVELMHAIFGYGCTSVRALQHQSGVTALCSFADGLVVTANFLTNVRPFHATAYGNTSGKQGWHASHLSDGTAYPNCMRAYLDMMRTGEWPFTPEQLVEPVQIFAAIDRSLKENREVGLDEV